MDAEVELSERPARGVRRNLRHLFLALAFFLVASEVVLLAGLYQTALRDGERRVIAAGGLAEEHIARTFQSAEYVLSQVADLGRSKPMEALARDETVWAKLNEYRLGLPEPGALWIIDTDGVARAGSLYFPVPPVNARDRYYFQAHLQGNYDLVIGPLVQTKIRDIQTFHLSRRIDDAHGRLIGVAAIGFDAPMFRGFHHSLDLGGQASLMVSGLDGRIILRHPDSSRFVGAAVSDDALESRIRAGETRGVFRTLSPLDQTEWMRAFKVLPRYGVAVGTGIPLAVILESWWQTLWFSLVGLMALLGGLGWLARQVFFGFDQEQAMIGGLQGSLRQRTLEAEARASEARSANESKTRFLAAASHDLRQPLQAAGMFAEALAARLEETPHMQVIDKLRQSLEATQLLLSTLLDVSTLEAGHVEPQPTTFSLASFLSRLAGQMELEAASRQLKFKVVAADAWVVSDPVLLERIIRNLLVNAFRYTRTGGVLLGCRRRGDNMLICVVDTGIGIPGDKFAHIFEDFTRLADKGRGQDRGLGLGLAVVRRTAHLLGHRIDVRSEVGKGSCFSVTVPLAR